MTQSTTRLQRDLGLIEAASIVVGTVIGTGIFLKPRAIAALLEDPSLIMLAWVIGGALSFLGALSYAELGALYPHAGGEYVFMRELYGRFGAFLWAWSYFVCAKIGSIAALGAGLAIYLKVFVPLPGLAEQATAVAAILLVTLVNVLGVAVGGRLQALLTVLKAASIVAIGVLAFLSPQGSWEHLRPSEHGASTGLLSAFGLALVAVLWAYDGWNDLVMVSGEIRDPERNIVRSLLWGMVLVTALYLGVNLAYHYALSVGEMAQTPQVAAAAVAGILGERGAAALSAIILVSILGALNGSILSGARIPYAAALDGLFPTALARVHPRYRTPHMALLAQGAMACLIIVVFTLRGSNQFDALTDMVIFAEWAFYGLCTLGLILLRRRNPDLPRPFRAPGYPYTQIVFVLAAIALCVNSLVEAPGQSSLIGLGLIGLGVPAYLLLSKHARKV